MSDYNSTYAILSPGRVLIWNMKPVIINIGHIAHEPNIEPAYKLALENYIEDMVTKHFKENTKVNRIPKKGDIAVYQGKKCPIFAVTARTPAMYGLALSDRKYRFITTKYGNKPSVYQSYVDKTWKPQEEFTLDFNEHELTSLEQKIRFAINDFKTNTHDVIVQRKYGINIESIGSDF